jgi:phosphoribosylaminoimidazolecarboxamide formyltransferase / IMP cyclohydrolase
MPRALISVSDKRGVVELARDLTRLGWEIVSTGGTARAIADAGVAVTPIERVTGFPEMMDGRVKTLHPAVHGALLARRHVPGDLAALKRHQFEPIDLVVVNLYPFRETVARPRVTPAEAIEQIDIGGPSMLRSAAKNHESVTVVVDPLDYARVLEALRSGGVSAALRRELAVKVFRATATYDAAIAEWLGSVEPAAPAVASAPGAPAALPAFLFLALERKQPLRYGENPDQAAGFYVTGESGGLADLVQLGGKELSFNNLLDLDAAVMALGPWPADIACVIIKHTTPCGLAVARTAAEAYRRALATDPVSAYGSVVGFNTAVDEETAAAMHDLFVEAVVAPTYQPGALEVLRRKKNLRIIEVPPAREGTDVGLDLKRVRSGFLVETRMHFDPDESRWTVATRRAPTAEELDDLRFAWAAVMSVKSNAILVARGGQALGIGAGQMSRVDSSMLAVHKARAAGHDVTGAVLASDAFFPFRDGVDEAAKAGVRAIIQPGGSVRDPEVVAAADEHGLAMILTGRRQFRH